MPSLRQNQRALRIPCSLSRRTLLLAAICFLQSIAYCSSCQTCFFPTLSTAAVRGSPPHHRHVSLKLVGSSVSATHMRATTAAVVIIRHQSIIAHARKHILNNIISNINDLVLRSKAPSKFLLVSIATAVAVGGVTTMKRCTSQAYLFNKSGILMSGIGKEEVEKDKDSKDISTDKPSELSAVMIGAIGLYKNFISPLLPPACRFVPTCSQYGVQAISEYGPTKGVILTSWRLLRCSPFGGRGYDPPKWPPVKFTYSSY
jgi:uncharacterized protein